MWLRGTDFANTQTLSVIEGNPAAVDDGDVSRSDSMLLPFIALRTRTRRTRRSSSEGSADCESVSRMDPVAIEIQQAPQLPVHSASRRNTSRHDRACHRARSDPSATSIH